MTRTALVVTPDLAELDRLARWLEAAGFLTVACAGPRLRVGCPRLEGQPCLLRDAVDVAVVALLADPPPIGSDEDPEASCTTTPDNGTTIFVDESSIVMIDAKGAPERLGALSELSLIEAVERVLSGGGQPVRSNDRRGSTKPAPGAGRRVSDLKSRSAKVAGANRDRRPV